MVRLIVIPAGSRYYGCGTAVDIPDRMRHTIVKMTIALAACSVIGSEEFIASAQQDRATVRVAGTVSPALKLSLNAPPVCGAEEIDDARAKRLTAAVEEADDNLVQLALKGESASRPSHITIPLAIRTNAAYRLSLRVMSSEGCLPNITASIASVRPSGKSVVPGAENSCRPVSLDPRGGPELILDGERVSMRGNHLTPGNALLVSVTLRVEGGEPTACNWRASLRASIEGRF